MRRRWRTAAILAFALVLIAAGVRLVAAPAFISAPDAVHIIVTEIQPPSSQSQPMRTTVMFDHEFTQQARPLYQQMVSGGPVTAGGGCPASSTQQPYYHYDLAFFHLGLQVATASSDAIDCMNFAVEYPDRSITVFPWLGSQHVSFWVRLSQLVGAPEPIGLCMTIPLCHS